ncbi:XRE family transcriptional regulator [Sporosarcina sp. BI001-red]|uniref:helix-turn-helix domain-containing protein n=1 Tax=Sporosarcina sp. BI001-red TaxID=2282866 RepID=UPI000E21F9EE|nr:XRE family transcriptional regulator [Sporosarcina sp. BI001-red]
MVRSAADYTGCSHCDSYCRCPGSEKELFTRRIETKPGTQIKKERLRQGVKLEVLAKGICSPSYVSRIENGK